MENDDVIIAKLGGTVFLDNDPMGRLELLVQGNVINASHNGGTYDHAFGTTTYHVGIKAKIPFSIDYDGRTYDLVPNAELLLHIYV